MFTSETKGDGVIATQTQPTNNGTVPTQWEFVNKDKNIIDLDIGETIVFKSSLYHKAKKVLHGTRLVLVAWLN